MTVSSWGQVPPGMPVHHHCVVSIESGNDPKRWVDASTTPPALVAWQYHDAVEWVHEQLVEHHRQAADELREYFDEVVSAYMPAVVGPDADHYRDVDAAHPPILWQRLPATLQRGDWVMEPFQVGPGRKLVLQILGFADRDQPSGQNRGRRAYQVCREHTRPEAKPYLGLTRSDTDHYAQYGTLYVPS